MKVESVYHWYIMFSARPASLYCILRHRYTQKTQGIEPTNVHPARVVSTGIQLLSYMSFFSGYVWGCGVANEKLGIVFEFSSGG